MLTGHSKRITVLVFVVALVAAACGQKEGTHVAAGDPAASRSTEAGGIDTAAGDAARQTGDAAASGVDGTADAAERTTRTVTRTAGGGEGTTGGGTAGGGTAGGGGGTAGGGGGGDGGALEPQGSDRTGVSESRITLGVHAPVTGAAPLPSTSFENLRDIYWKWKVDQGGDVLGRSEVEVLFRDDKYSPSSARQVCREMADRAFLLVGGGGTDQIQACGDFSNRAQVPYLSAGVTERGLRGLPWYYATSMSYKQQGDLLGQYVSKSFPDSKVAMIVTDTPNFDDAVAGWEAAVERYGIDYYKTLSHPKQDQSWYNSYGNELKNEGVDVVYMLTSPVDYIQFAQQNENDDGGPGFQYVGVGITMALNAILPTGCTSVDGGIFFSPFPGLDWARQNVPTYFEAAEEFGGGAEADDLGLALWMLAAQQDLMFDRYQQTFGNDLTREDFRAVLERQQGMETGIGPPLSYTPDDHFGAGQVHVLQADCSEDKDRDGDGEEDGPEYVTLQTFASGF